MSKERRKPTEPKRPFYDEDIYRIKNPFLGMVMAEYPERLVHPSEALERRGQWKDWTQGRPLHVEIGPGKGKFATEYALAHPEAVFLAIENKFKRMYKVAKRFASNGADNAYMLRFDGNFLRHLFAPGEVAHLFLQFPDPWWKKERHKFMRMVTPEFLEMTFEVLKPGGIFDIKTDHRLYFEEILSHVAESPFRLTRETRDLAHSSYAEGNIETIFEEKFRERGLPAYYLRIEKPVKPERP